MTKLAFINGKVYTPELKENVAVLVNQGKVERVIEASEIEKLQDYELIDLKGSNLSPGFIDLQVNGCGGANFNETLDNLCVKTLEVMRDCNYKFGCTSFLPTLITSPYEFRKKALEVIKEYHELNPEEVNVVPGLHIEGPHISKIKKGTHNVNYIKPIEDKDLQLYLSYAPYIKMLTLAPEENDLAKVKELLKAGVLISLGHTNATYEQAQEYIEAGVTCATHLYNAMSSIANGRTPGVIGAIYESDKISPGIIVDGVHVAWPLVNLSIKVKGDNIFIVTDALMPAGSDLTEFYFANKLIRVIDEGCYDENGVLSGSAITMDSQLRRLHKHSDLTLEQVIKLATYNPAKQLGLENKIGVIKEGADANLIIFDNNFTIQDTYVNGKQVYTSKE
ncbi:N-acetylglucosamine-6-phosphate deacetylase [Psittacicella gerlachiana]|uniref:N-acetylglucosamine-6-phosphate deacetylase n=1 Tax=Psittacicella gerlachiana TaxID=2028574 RepID=A0A3A1YNX1_9GAMM|nr:N-acetylglucosamine-6-phosphate deacetylase [Psittacicella gerlachiana]RIY38928.1 N-acetylglucosamine-6-phosphate deacetylase [Psittacicella gerlachiana]